MIKISLTQEEYSDFRLTEFINFVDVYKLEVTTYYQFITHNSSNKNWGENHLGDIIKFK